MTDQPTPDYDPVEAMFDRMAAQREAEQKAAEEQNRESAARSEQARLEYDQSEMALARKQQQHAAWLNSLPSDVAAEHMAAGLHQHPDVLAAMEGNEGEIDSRLLTELYEHASDEEKAKFDARER